MMNRLTILGSGSTNLIPGQGAASALVELDGTRLVFDMGRGTASRLAESRLRQDDIQHLFLSHFHPDHVTDLHPYLHAASWSQLDRRTKDLNIYGREGTKDFIAKMFSVFDWKEELMRGFKVRVHEVQPGPLKIGRLELLWRRIQS
jgi:ribonuclease BN (tRNA processing enzyme)